MFALLAGLILLLIIVVLLLVPIVLTISAQGCLLSWQWSMRASWLYGLITVDLQRQMKRRTKEEPEEPRESEEPGGIGRRIGGLPPVGLVRHAFQLMWRILGLLDVRGRVWLRFGTWDPVLTGELTGYLYALWGGVAGALERVRFRVDPDFLEETLEGSAELEVRVRPLWLIPPLIWLLVQSEVWRYIIESRRNA